MSQDLNFDYDYDYAYDHDYAYAHDRYFYKSVVQYEGSFYQFEIGVGGVVETRSDGFVFHG